MDNLARLLLIYMGTRTHFPDIAASPYVLGLLHINFGKSFSQLEIIDSNIFILRIFPKAHHVNEPDQGVRRLELGAALQDRPRTVQETTEKPVPPEGALSKKFIIDIVWLRLKYSECVLIEQLALRAGSITNFHCRRNQDMK